MKEEQLSHYQKKAAGWKGTTIKNKKIAAARFHATGEESSISSSDMKNYEGGSIFGDLHNGGKLFSANFNSSHGNFAAHASLFIFQSYLRKLQNA